MYFIKSIIFVIITSLNSYFHTHLFNKEICLLYHCNLLYLWYKNIDLICYSLLIKLFSALLQFDCDWLQFLVEFSPI